MENLDEKTIENLTIEEYDEILETGRKLLAEDEENASKSQAVERPGNHKFGG